MTHNLDLAIGQEVLIEGRIVGRSEFENGNVRYCVVIQRGGKSEQLWLRGDEMEVDDAE